MFSKFGFESSHFPRAMVVNSISSAACECLSIFRLSWLKCAVIYCGLGAGDGCDDEQTRLNESKIASAERTDEERFHIVLMSVIQSENEAAIIFHMLIELFKIFSLSLRAVISGIRLY